MQQPQIDITKTTPVVSSEGNQVWVQGFLLRKVSRFITGGTGDSIAPIAIFYDPNTGEICKDGLPEEVIKLIEDIDEIKE